MLRSLSFFLGILTFLTSALGVLCFYLVYRPAGLAEWLAAIARYAPNVVNPVVLLAALAALGTMVAARILDRRRPVEPIGRKSHALGVDVLGAGSPDPAAEGGEAIASSRRELVELRLRLEGLLQGRPEMIAFIDELLGGAIRRAASDIHIQPLELVTRISFRVQGMLEDIASIPEIHHPQIVRRLKVLAELVPYKTDAPQDGHFTLETPLGAVDVRMSAVPTHHGEKIVLRLALAGAGLYELDRLGMPDELRLPFQDLLREPQGLVVLTGPTGSGKTTTLYGSLAHIHRTRGETSTISTIEDPIEVDMPFLNQTQVDKARGLGFAEGLRALLRQDPNVMMVGEIRDEETAQIAVQAGLTGHLILTSLHAESAAGVFPRLIDAGVEPFLVASATLACLSQRLVRRLCPECRRPARVSAKVMAQLAAKGIAASDFTFYQSDGCAACDRSGLHGRMAIFEMLRMTPPLRRLITTRAPTDRIEETACAEGMTPLARAAVAQAAAGHISLDEALRVTG